MRATTSALRSLRRKITLLLDPLRHKQERLRHSRSATLDEKIAYDVFPRPHYAYGVYKAVQQAAALGIQRFCVIEFGVAGGNGLLALEQVAQEIGEAAGVQIDVYGFDTGKGLPPPTDYRDLPYAWQAGQFSMNREALVTRLKSAKLVIGDVSETLAPFLAQRDGVPVGFVALDLDFYSSTVSALRLFESEFRHFLPRVFCYFDDCIGPDHEIHCEYVGELLAIAEFNQRHQDRKLALIHGLRHKRILPAAWNDVMYVLHAFQHPMYGRYVASPMDMRLSLPPGDLP